MPAKHANHSHQKILTDICMALNNCADCKKCHSQHMLGCYQNLIITANDQFCIDPYDEKTNAKLIAIAERNGYDAGVIVDGGSEYMEFIKN